MPRKIDPKNKIKPSTGLAGSDSIEANAFPDTDPNMAVGVGLEAHINDPVNAHPASAIGYENEPIYFGDNVDDVLDELGGLVPPRPPTIGNSKSYLDFVGIPDWGILKLDDDSLPETLFLHPNDGRSIYPYYHSYPKNWSSLAPNERRGVDLASDTIFNITDATYNGGGDYGSFAGGFARNNKIVETHNVISAKQDHCVISGAIFPADRGTVAIFHIPAEGDLTDIQCVAALNCGQGIEDGCDGETGGIWNYGVDDDPYQFPSAASGQYDLQELHTGYVRNSMTAITIIQPTADPSLALIGWAIPPASPANEGDKIYIQGSDSTPNIDGEWEVVSVGPGGYIIAETITVDGTVGVVGTPLTPIDFSALYADNTAGQVREEYTILGGTDDSVAPNKGADSRNANNFFRYRLPYLENYAELIWTPKGESPRYFLKPSVSFEPATKLDFAGNYTNFNKDYWTFQVARYRHRFPIVGSEERGNYFIVHFKKEEYFEDLLLDGIAPTQDKIYSANMVDWSDIEGEENIYEESGVLKPSSSYHILKSRIFADPDGNQANISPPSYSITRAVDDVLYVSGVRYFKNSPDFGIINATFEVNRLFEFSWRMGEGLDSTEQNKGFEMPYPVHFFTGQFGRRMTITAAHGKDANNRIEIPYTLLGAYDLTNAPQPADVASWASPSPIIFDATSSPVFSSDATPYVHVRQPLKHIDGNYVTSRESVEKTGLNIMVHSTDESIYQDSTNPFYTPSRDVQEDFLDEAYRWIFNFPNPNLSLDELKRLLGTGLPTVGVINIPVRVGAFSPAYSHASFMVQGKHLTSIANSPEAQVTGLPNLNPPMIEGIREPNAPRGCLVYPQTNYETTCRPSLAQGDLTTAQPDYSVCTGDKVYIRAFDAAFSRSNPNIQCPEAIGSSLFKLRIHGLELRDFAWSGGAEAGGEGIAIFVKLAGLTTWMDIGRVDGSGASKQDAFSDGAGCQVNDPTETKEGHDPVTGIIYSDVLIHTGIATLYDNGVGEAPILVKVVIKDNPVGRHFLRFESQDVIFKSRGLVGIEIVHPKES